MLLSSACIRSQKKQKPPKHQAANFSETRFGTFAFRASAIARQGTVASPARLPGSELSEPLLMLVPIIAASLIGERGALGFSLAGVRKHQREPFGWFTVTFVTIRGTLGADAAHSE
jgi:hypothetical protein